MNVMHRHKKSASLFATVFMFTFIVLPFSIAQANGSIAVQSLSPGASLSVGTSLTLSVQTSGLTNPSFVVDDNFGGTTLSNANMNSSGTLSWTPTANDIGTHLLVITAGDSLGGTSVSQTITVLPPTMTLSSPSPSASVNAGVTVTFSAAVSGFSGPTYSVSDSFGGSISNSNINSSGYFSWVPSAIDIGSHSITVTATDAQGHSTSATKSITVNPASGIGVSSLSPGTTVTPGQRVTFSITSTGFSSPIFSLHDSFTPSTVGSVNLNTSGNFSWTPTAYEVGTHVLFVTVTDGTNGHSLSLTQTINVQPFVVNIQGTIPDSTSVGSSIYFTLTTGTFASSTYSTRDSFTGSTVSSANLNAVGYFYWKPTQNDIGTHVLTFTANNPSGHTASTSRQVIVHAIASSTESEYPTTTTTTSAAAATPTQPSFAQPSTQSSSMSTLLLQIQALQSQLAALKAEKNVSTPPPYKFLTPLALGSSGTGVTELQKRLTKEGVYTGPINGRFGPLTKAAVKKYQAKHGLAQLGNVGPKTRAALNAK